MVRAISAATGMSWLDVYDALHMEGRAFYDMPSSNEVWGRYLYRLGFQPFFLPESCPKCLTIREFAKRYPRGRYVIGTGTHAVAVIDGDYFDTFDSGELVPSYYFKVR